MSSKSVDLKKLKKEMNDVAISLKKYLLIYYGIHNENENFKISHSDVASLMPYVKRVGFSYVLSHKSDLYKGKIVSVIDSYGNVAPYMVPSEINKYFDDDFYYKEETKIVKTVVANENLNIHELVILLRLYKSKNRLKEYNAVKEIIERKKQKEKVYQYKKKKFDLCAKKD